MYISENICCSKDNTEDCCGGKAKFKADHFALLVFYRRQDGVIR